MSNHQISKERFDETELSVHEYAEIIMSSWNRAWNTLKSAPEDVDAAIELIRLTLTYCVLNREQYVQVLSVAKSIEQRLTPEQINSAFEDWQWVVDYLSSMTGKVDYSAMQMSPPQRRSLVNRSLRIGVDIRCMEIESTRNRGIGRYVTNLIKQLARVGSQHRIILFGNDAPWDIGDAYGLFTAPNIEYCCYYKNFSEAIDVYLITDPLPVLAGRELLPYPVNDVPVATIIYDLIPLAFPARYIAASEKIHRQYIGSLREIVRLSSCYLPISNFIGEELQERVGIDSRSIFPILGGLDESFLQPARNFKTALFLKEHGIASRYFVYAGGADFRKNIDTLLKAFVEYREHSGSQAQLVLVGESMEKRVQSTLRGTRGEKYVSDIVCPGFVTDEELRGLYSQAIALVFPSLHEGFGLPALEAMACNCPVIASNSTSLKEIIGDAGLLVNPHAVEEIADAMQSLSSDASLVEDYRTRGARRAHEYTWEDVATRALEAIGNIATDNQRLQAPSRKLRVLVQNRPDAFSARGGDTVVMDQLYKSLRNLDVGIDVACGSPNLAEIDLVHLINLTVRETGTEVTQNAARHGVPLVVTTLLEDWPRYLEKSLETARIFQKYLLSGQDEQVFRAGMEKVRSLDVQALVGNEHVVDYASALIACGDTEAKLIEATYPQASKKIGIAQFAVTNMSKYAFAEPKEIQKAFGFGEYIVCCGRLETRKNQLMLLKALEDSDVTIILVGGGFSAQPEYVQLVRSFKRKGRVIPVQRISLHKLANIMKGARAHVLPSWYELPGLVTLEAATCGTPVVASNWGAILDYLPEHLINTCSPDDPESVYSATMKALESPRSEELAERAQAYTLERFGEQVYNIYERVLSSRDTGSSRGIVTNSETKKEEIKETRQEAKPMKLEKKSFDVSVIIPVYNQVNLTRACLEAISNDSPRASYEVIIIDNHSTDETPQLLEAVEGDIKVLREPMNRGFAAACNRGARLADGKYLLFLNNDTAPQPGWLDAMVECAELRDNIGAVGAKLVYPNGKIQHSGIVFNEDKTPFNLFQNFPADHPAVNEEREMQAVSAACMLVPTDVYATTGGFDEEYQNGFEDVDFCLRLAQLNKEVVYCATAEVVHHEESTAGRKDHDAENLELFLTRWAAQVRADDNEFTSRFGLRIDWNERGGVYVDAAKPVEQTATHENLNTTELIDKANKKYLSGDYDGAVQMLQSVVESKMTLANEDGFEAWQTLGNCYARLNQAEQAEKAYLEAVRLNENSERPYLGLGSVAMLQQNWTAAQYGFMAALAKNPKTTRGEFGIGISLAARGKHEESIDHFRSVVEAEPDNTEALFYLYRSAMETNNPLKVLDALEKYVLSHPNDKEFLYHFCGVLWKLGELTRAMEICDQILEIDPNYTPAKEAYEHMRTTIAEHA